MQINQLFPQNDEYPVGLSEISAPPRPLYVLGNLPQTPMIAIVGTRALTRYGKQITYQLASELARAGFVIVSGLALGVDGVAHRAALDAGGTTVAVLACGLDRMYPATHRQLAIEILARGGAIVSEYAAGTPPLKHHFIERNRLISALSIGTIITESGDRGGAMFTAKAALDQNRTLMAVPGDITRPSATGPNNLIRRGAVPVTSSTDVLEALNYKTGLIPASVVRAQNPHEARIVELLKSGLSHSQDLIAATGLEAGEFASVITLMEITGKVRNLGAGTWAAR